MTSETRTILVDVDTQRDFIEIDGKLAIPGASEDVEDCFDRRSRTELTTCLACDKLWATLG